MAQMTNREYREMQQNETAEGDGSTLAKIGDITNSPGGCRMNRAGERIGFGLPFS
jgi:hypothetical protein